MRPPDWSWLFEFRCSFGADGVVLTRPVPPTLAGVGAIGGGVYLGFQELVPLGIVVAIVGTIVLVASLVRPRRVEIDAQGVRVGGILRLAREDVTDVTITVAMSELSSRQRWRSYEWSLTVHGADTPQSFSLITVRYPGRPAIVDELEEAARSALDLPPAARPSDAPDAPDAPDAMADGDGG